MNPRQYKVFFVPALYTVPDELLLKLKQYAADGEEVLSGAAANGSAISLERWGVKIVEEK